MYTLHYAFTCVIVCDSCKVAAMSLDDVAKLADSLVTLSDIPWYLIAYFSLSTLFFRPE